MFALVLLSCLAVAGPPPMQVFVRVAAPPSAEVRALLESIGVRGFALAPAAAAEFGQALAAPLVVDDLIDQGEFSRSPAQFDEVFGDYWNRRDPALASRPDCPWRAPLPARLRARALREAAAVAALRPVAISLCRDPSLTCGSEPFDYCYCESCVAAWRADLLRRFGDRAAAGAALGTTFESDDAIAPLTVDQVRARNLDQPRAAARLGRWLDYRAFLERRFAATLGELSVAARTASGSPAGFFGGAPPNPFSGLDWARLALATDVLSPPEDPTARRVVHDLRPELPLFSSLSATGGAERPTPHKLLDHFLLGTRAAVVTSLDALIDDTDGGPRLSAFARELGKVLAFLDSDAARELAAAEPVPARVGIVFSQRSLAIDWLRATEPDGIGWLARGSRHDGEVLPMAATWWAWQWLLDDAGIEYRYVSDEGIEADPAALADLKVLVLPRVLAVSHPLAVRLRDFATGGGALLADGELGLFDALGRGREHGALDDVFGVKRDDAALAWDRRDRGLADEASGLPRLEAGVTAPLDLESAHALWLNLDVDSYLPARERRDPRADRFADQIGGWFASRGVERLPRVVFADPARRDVPRVRVRRFRTAGGATLLAVIRNESLPEVLDAAFDATHDGPVRYRWQGADEFELGWTEIALVRPR